MKTPSFLLAILVASLPAVALSAPTTITWHGHATFEITTPNGAVLMIDPWLKNPKNPKAANKQDPLPAIKKVDYILITHAHTDHVGDAAALAKQTKARLVANSDLAPNLAKILGYPKEQMGFDTLMNMGGMIQVANGEVTIAMTPAFHGSGLGNPHAGAQDPDVVYGGNPVGFVIKIKNGPTVYHTGDTAYFSDMALIGEQYQPDVALVNIGGHFGMEPDMAARAAQTVKAKIAIPQHFGTYPVLNQDTKAFAEAVKKAGIQYAEMTPGSSITFEGSQLVKK